ncbi:MAG: HipA N-terminal domain-containing protein [Candidatus Omnitrophica bacterium]|nr:HipA N-terminal domain-containing protein [Candidatus Omnitrophota bacterium]
MVKRRTAKVNYQGQWAGLLLGTENGYRFVYDQNYLRSGNPISVSLPLRSEPYKSDKLLSFFEGLLPEGWYLDIVRATEKIDVKDSFPIRPLRTRLRLRECLEYRRAYGADYCGYSGKQSRWPFRLPFVNNCEESSQIGGPLPGLRVRRWNLQV